MNDTPIAFRMQLKPGCEAEYKRRHDEIWPDLVKLLQDAGIYDYSIFLDVYSLGLVAVLRLRPNNKRATLALHPVMQRWWDYMSDLMVTQPGNRPIEEPLEMVFRLP